MGKFIGREKELSILKQKVDSALGKKGSTVFLFGNAGTGKTRLVSEAIKYAKDKNFKILVGEGIKGVDVDFEVMFSALKKYLIIKDRGESDEKGKLLRAIKHASPDIVAVVPIVGDIIAAGTSLFVRYKEEQGELKPREIDSNADKDTMFNLFKEMINDLSSKVPLLLFFDNLHFADEESLKIMHYLSRLAIEKRIFIICSYDLEHVKENPQLRDTIQRMNREKLFLEMPLQNLTEPETIELVSELSKEKAGEKTAKEIYSKTNGNMFLIEEIVKNINWKNPKIELPETTKEIIEGRLKDISENDRKVLEIANAIGKQFTFSQLLEKSNLPEEKLMDSIDSLIDKKLIKEIDASKDLYEMNCII
ncbi:MAG: AAA family ATPase [Candidatus Diapherotrites archaeon]|nr:AAA family ATPase [Candidatus Diapherotrites archaeon]